MTEKQTWFWPTTVKDDQNIRDEQRRRANKINRLLDVIPHISPEHSEGSEMLISTAPWTLIETILMREGWMPVEQHPDHSIWEHPTGGRLMIAVSEEGTHIGVTKTIEDEWPFVQRQKARLLRRKG